MDALNAIVSENGGKFELKNSIFQNNYTSVMVINYFSLLSLPAHKGKIYGCTFEKSGTGMIEPYLNIKPRHGIYLDNVYNITIGDSTQMTNTYWKVFCGIASFNSSANVYNNNFMNIKIPVACQGVLMAIIQAFIAKRPYTVFQQATTADITMVRN